MGKMRQITNPLVRERMVNGRPDGHLQCSRCGAFDFGHRDACSQMKPFPIQGGGSIPWWLAEVAFEYYQEKCPGQSLQRLAERGGFGVRELIGLIRREL